MKYKMLHTCLRVMDLDKSLEFYTNLLGLIEVKRKDFPDYKFTNVYLADDSRSYELELTYNYNPEKPYEIGNGFSHTAFSVDNLEEEREKHIALGYEVTALKGLPGELPHYYFITDPDGYKVEILRA